MRLLRYSAGALCASALCAAALFFLIPSVGIHAEQTEVGESDTTTYTYNTWHNEGDYCGFLNLYEYLQ